MIKRIGLFLLLVTVAASADGEDGGNAPALKQNTTLPPMIMEKYDYYEVCGCCEKDLDRELKQKCITWNDGKKYDSVTNWKLKWDYGRIPAPGFCTAGSFTVKVDITYQLPKWARTADVPKQLVAKWEAYQKNLLVHEQGHRDIAVTAAKGLTQAVAELAPASSCAELDNNVRTLADRMSKKLMEDENQYDVATNHGKTKGAIFP